MGSDPEVKNTQYGNVANFSVATSEKWKDKTSGETKDPPNGSLRSLE